MALIVDGYTLAIIMDGEDMEASPSVSPLSRSFGMQSEPRAKTLAGAHDKAGRTARDRGSCDFVHRRWCQ